MLSKVEYPNIVRAQTTAIPQNNYKDYLAYLTGGAAGYGTGLPIGGKLGRFVTNSVEFDPRAVRLNNFRNKYLEQVPRPNPWRWEGDGFDAKYDKSLRALDKADQRYTKYMSKLTKGYTRAGKGIKHGVPLVLAALGTMVGKKSLDSYRDYKIRQEAPFNGELELVKKSNAALHALTGFLGFMGMSAGAGVFNKRHVDGHLKGSYDPNNQEQAAVRSKLLDRAREKGVFVGYPEDVARARFNGDPRVEKQLRNMGPFYSKDLPLNSGPMILKKRDMDYNGTLAHELGHALDDPKIFRQQVKGQQLSPMLTLGILLGRGRSMAVPTGFAAAATAAHVPILRGEYRASKIGVQEMLNAGGTDAQENAKSFAGLPTYAAAASVPAGTLALKGLMMRAAFRM